MDEKNKKELKNVLILILMLVDAGAICVGSCLIFFIFFIIKDIFIAIPVSLFIIILIIFLSNVISGLLGKKFNNKGLIITGSVLCGVLCFFLGYYLYDNFYKTSITVKQDSFFLEDYLCNQEKIEKLDKESKIDFNMAEKLPVVDGATALIPVYCAFAKNGYPDDVDLNVKVFCSKTNEAYERLLNNYVDIIFVAEPSEEQKKMAEEKNVTFKMYPIGYEAFVFIVNKKNKISDISIDQVKNIYTGKITNWKQLGGKNQEIIPYQRKENSGSQSAFYRFMGKDAEIIAPLTHQEATLMFSLVDVVNDYENHDGAIGYSFRYYIETMQNAKYVKMLSLNGIAPTVENIRNHTYPVSNNFYAITIAERETENDRRLINWVQSEAGQELVEKVGYVRLDVASDKDSLEVNTSLTELFERLNHAAGFQNKNKVEECLSEINKYYEVHPPIYKEEIRNRPFNEMWMNCKDAATARFLIDNDYISDVFDELCISEHFIPKLIEYKNLECIAKAFDYLKKLDSKKYSEFVKSQCAVDDFYFVFDYSYKRKIINMKDVSIEEKISLLKNTGFDFSPLDAIYLSPDEREKFYKLVKVDINQKVLPFDANAIFYARMNDESYEDFLLAHGADIKYRDANGRNVLYYAMITRPNVMYQDNLIETKDEINWEMLGWILEGLGDKPYFRTELIERVKKYISLGADVNNQDKYGWTVLHYASTTPWYRELRKLLLENGADPTIKTNCGRTADDVKKYFPEGWDNPKFWEGE